jgi:hypothetical protein
MKLSMEILTIVVTIERHEMHTTAATGNELGA